MRNFLEGAARTVEQWERLGAALDGTGFGSSEALRQQIPGDHLEQFLQQLLLSFAGTGLGNGGRKLADGVEQFP